MYYTKILRIILTVILLQSKLKKVQAKSNFELTYTEFNCTVFDPKEFVEKLSCSISKNTKRSSLFMELVFKKDLKHFNINFLVVLPRRPVNFVLLNLTHLNGCQLMANRVQVPFVQILLNSLKRVSNFMQGCPYKRDTLYYFRGLRLNLDAMPAVSFETDMKLWVDFMYERSKLFTFYIDSRIQLRRKGSEAKQGA
ncbi:PREDICTED: uncharacterized protein LOC108971773 [Bactrocera latifrons]|uniref:uncharacterized protein LOC108971773 n=1 Tax=Bactrocera latifrons TaxID=174628 RepID=UPI0008DE8F6E|nr:PREDICTED: uncharacterized protein LOC108971773 [Bactrocera latifrons]